MRVLSRTAALLPLLAALPASAQNYWHCTVHEEGGGLRANLTQPYFGPDRPIIQPVQRVSISAGGIFFSAASWPHWRSLDAPFEAPREIHIGINLPQRAASRRLTLYAPGTVPIRPRVYIYGAQADAAGVGLELRDRNAINAVLTHPDWTAIIHHADGRVQQVVPFRMPMSLDRLRALREGQVARLREMARNPGRHCQPANDEAEIVAR